jgi:hypothetical protein
MTFIIHAPLHNYPVAFPQHNCHNERNARFAQGVCLMRLCSWFITFLLMVASAIPTFAQTDIGNAAETFFTDVQNILQGVALAAAAVSFLTLGLIYVLSTWPPVAQYKAQHPELMQNVVIGLVIILFVSGGTLAGLIAF